MKKVTISIKGSQAAPGDDADEFELLTDGEYTRHDDVSTFSYIESELTGYNGLLTTFNVESERVVLKRGGESNGDMIFCENQKHHFLYDTPFGAITMGIDTHRIEKDLSDDGGKLEILYDIEVDNVAISRNLFKIDITQSEV